MKSKYIYIGLLAIGLTTVATVYSCKKGALDTTNNNVLSLQNAFNTSDQLVSAVNSVYSVLHSQNLVGREWFFLHDMRGDDDATGGSQLEVARAQLLAGNVSPANPVMNAVWNSLYTLIHRANTVTDNASRVTDNAAVRDRVVGEAKFLRAWAYWELVSQWGGVPLYTTTVKTADGAQPRATVASVYAQIIKDLTDASTALPGKSGYAGTDIGRVTKSAAYALLGRAYMQMGDYQSAETALLKIPTSGADGYTLTSRYLDNFEEETEFNSESVFEVIYSDKGDNGFNWDATGTGPTADQTTVRNQEENPIGWRNLIPSNKYLNEFESTAKGAVQNDPRLSYSVYRTGDTFDNGTLTLVDADQNGNSSIINGVTVKAGWRKFQLIYKEDRSTASFHPGSNNQRIIRYAEVLLMLAECENELSKPAAAIGYLNQVRVRPSVAMPPYPTTQFPVNNKNAITAAIMHEKSVELGGEEIRNIDIIRWRKMGYYPSIAPEPFSYYTAGAELLPIPQAEIDNNPNL
jgi:tetratricopeptide (TPR) repeat protein